jgi:hypothetical protein
MKKTLTRLVATTALTAAIGFPAWSAIRPSADGNLRPIPALSEDSMQTVPLVLAGSDDGDGKQHARKSVQRGRDDSEDDDDDDEGRGNRNGAGNPAPAGSVAPPKNGLFGNGAAPQVQVN